MRTLLHWLLSAVAVMITTYVLGGVHVTGFFVALIVALVLGFLNAIVRPLLLVLTLPINILTLGLFTFVVNAVIVLLASAIVPGFTVDGFWWALLFSLVLTIVNWILAPLSKKQSHAPATPMQ